MKKPNNKEATPDPMEVEQFFRSAWCRELTNVEGACLMQRLRKEANAV